MTSPATPFSPSLTTEFELATLGAKGTKSGKKGSGDVTPVKTYNNLHDLLEAMVDDGVINKVVTEETINFNNLTDGNKKVCLIIAVHCCLNGPVGVNKVTKFPLIAEEFSIKTLAPCTNRTWRNFCRMVATQLKEYQLPDCYTLKAFGDLWPLCEDQEEPME